VLEDRCVPSTFTVNSTLDTFTNHRPTPGTLRWAVDHANRTTGTSTIVFDQSVFAKHKKITLFEGFVGSLFYGGLDLSNTTGTETITGPAAGVTVSGSGHRQMGQVFQIDGLVSASISGLTITGGSGYGGVRNEGTATLTDCTVSDNSSVGYNAGAAGVGNGGTLTLTNCTVSGNSAQGVYGASGGGVSNGGTATLTNCTISGNSVAAQSASGGGLENTGTLTLTNCTVSGNSASSGGGVFNKGTATLTNCTVSGNSASNGGGLYNSGTATLANTIIAGDGADVSGAVTSQGNNLIGATNGSSGWVGSDRRGTSAHPLNPLLATLASYGGPTQTMAPLPGSPAIDAGNDALIPPGVTTDQRGSPRIVHRQVDIGAFESSGFTISVTSGSGQSTGVLTAFPAPLVVTVTADNPIEPVAGGLVRFTPPASGASAALTGSPASISGSGTASVTAVANGSAGSYTVSATARGIKAPARFSLTNTSLNMALDPSASGALRLAGNAGIKTMASANEAALSIRAERPSADSPRSPFGATTSGAGGGLSAGNELDHEAAVLGDGKVNTLTAEPAWAAVDGFFADAALEPTTIKDLETR
jgi:hypothetical protein